MHRVKSIITAATLSAWILVAPAAFALPSRPDDPSFNPKERIIQLVKRIVKPLFDIVVPKG